MSTFLMRFSYTPETWAALMEHPEDRSEAAREYVEELGGSMHGFWYGFGEYDGYMVFDAPDEIAAAGVVLAVTAGGALSSCETTALMTVEDTLKALEQGHAIKYRKPGVEVPVRAVAHA
jgi:uncharacterized protein with GYD domain